MVRCYKIKISFIIFFLTAVNVLAQEESNIKSDFHKAENYLEQAKYEEALPLYLQVLETAGTNSNFNYRVGQCYINILGQERKALAYLEKAVVEIDEDYKADRIERTGASPEAWLLLGDAHLRDENLEEASKAYHKYREYVADDEEELQIVSDRIMALGINQGEVRDHAKDVVLSNLGNTINSKSSDYNIIYSGDEKTMVFTRYEKRSDIIFASYFRDGSWTTPIDISAQIGSEGDMYATDLSYDGTELYLVMLTAYDADLYVSKFENGEWQYANNIGKSVNSKYIESNASVSADGKTLFFSSDRAASIGGFDIFYSTRESKDDLWSKAENLGEVINTKSNEESPHITTNGKTLYFSSDRTGSIGRMDIYYSRLVGDAWGVPENMGMPYNTVDDDVSFKYYEKYRKGYIARDLPGGFGKLDLYLIQSGADRQHELQDYMASLKKSTPEPEPEQVAVVEDTLVVEPIANDAVVDVEEEPLTSLEQENEEVESPTLPVVPVVAVTAAAVVADNVNTEPEELVVVEPEPVKEEPEVVEETIAMVEEEPVTEPEPEPIAVVVETPVPVTVESNYEFEGSYTVQILALIYPKRQIDFRGLDMQMIREIKGSDGYTRYTYGQYNSSVEAREALKRVFASDFHDAFIRSTDDIDNFSNP